jgi:hypothetical protein
MSDDLDFDRLLSRIEEREAAARRRTILWSLIPIAIGAIVLGGMVRGVRTLQTEAEHARGEANKFETEADRARGEANELQQRVTSLEKQLQQTTDLNRFSHPIDFTDLKMIASRYPGAERGLELILTLRQRNVPWRLGGRSPSEGFDSPGFAAYVIQQVRPGLLARLASTDLVAASHTLKTTLPPTSTPQPGDLVFYPSGYALFRFDDRHNRPFVIGMTPQGILALDPDFSQSVGAAHIAW